MATITDLPNEIIELILENKNTSIEDVVNLEATCNRLQQITFSMKFWRQKFHQRFPSSKKNYKNNTNEKKLRNIFNHAGTSIECMKRLEYYISLMPYNDLCGIGEEFARFLSFVSKHSMIYYFVLDDISRIMSTPRHDSNLTTKYHFGLTYFHWLRRYRLIHEQNKLISLPKEKLLLERQITIIVQYFLSYVSYSDIDTWLDDIVQEILRRLKNKHPTHSVFSISSEKFIFWRYNNIDDNFWTPTESRRIMCILEEYIFSELKFQKLVELLIILNIESKYINYILEYQGHILPIVYQNVARRLGIRCFSSNTNIIEILWAPKYNKISTEEQQTFMESFYIDRKSNLQYPANINRRQKYFRVNFSNPVHNISKILTKHLCDLKNHCNILYYWKLIKMANILTRSFDEFDIEYVRMDNGYEMIVHSIKKATKIVKKIQPEIRDKKIKFAIGIIVHINRHVAERLDIMLREIDSHTGVIIGWHYKCEAWFVKRMLESFVPYLSKCCDTKNDNDHFCICRCDKIYHNIHERIQFTPHYIILAENNMLYYLPQDTLSICSPRWINNIEIGRYFSKFEDTHYIPNESLAKEYPTDMAAFHEILPSIPQQCA